MLCQAWQWWRITEGPLQSAGERERSEASDHTGRFQGDGSAVLIEQGVMDGEQWEWARASVDQSSERPSGKLHGFITLYSTPELPDYIFGMFSYV